MRRWVVALAVMAWASHAAAQEPRTPAAVAQALAAEADAADLFEILPSESQAVLRHIRSRLVCRMDAAATNRIVVFPQAARGEDVACDSAHGHESTTLYATRFSFETSLDEQLRAAEAAIRRRFPDARPVQAAEPEPASSRTIEFLMTRDGAPMYTRASVTFINGWAIKLRYTAEAPDRAAVARAQAAAAALWRSTIAEIAAGA